MNKYGIKMQQIGRGLRKVKTPPVVLFYGTGISIALAHADKFQKHIHCVTKKLKLESQEFEEAAKRIACAFDINVEAVKQQIFHANRLNKCELNRMELRAVPRMPEVEQRPDPKSWVKFQNKPFKRGRR